MAPVDDQLLLLTQDAVRASDKRAQFVGVTDYEAAGGTVLRDLFESDDGGWLQDPALLDRLVAEKKADAGKQPPPPPTLAVPTLKDPLTDAERMEIARLARLAGQAKESGVFFRLQLKPAPKEAKTTDVGIDPRRVERSSQQSTCRLNLVDTSCGSADSQPRG